MLHNAAVLTFHSPDRSRDPWRTNVGGTQNVLDFCRATEIRKMHYVSTAYVCGARDDLVMEDELDPHHGFRNDYEESKYLAEQMVRAADFLDQLTVYRPAVIAGDSKTGYTYTYHGLYMYLKLISVLVTNSEPGEDGVRHTPVQLNMTGEEPRNIITVDWVSEVIAHLVSTPAAHGQTFHLAPTVPLTPRQIIEAGYTYFNSCGVEFVGPEEPVEDRVSTMDEQYHENTAIYSPYEASDPQFDLTNLQRFAGDIPCPAIDMQMLHLFWKYGEEDRWGKRREPKAQTDFRVDEYLSQISTANGSNVSGHENGSDTDPLTFGLNVLGPGGGQWRLSVIDSLVDVSPGLLGNEPVLTIESSLLASVCQGNGNGDLAAMVDRFTSGLLNQACAKRIADSLFPSASSH